MTGSDVQYENKNVTFVFMPSVCTKNLIYRISSQPVKKSQPNQTHEKAVISRSNPTQTMHGPNPSPTLSSIRTRTAK